MKSYRIAVEGETFLVEIVSDPRQERVRVRVDGAELTVQVQPADSTEAPEFGLAAPAVAAPALSSPAPSHSGGVHLRAPLPGTILQIHVEPGQAVARGSELLVIEAMKMNNRIRSPQDGTVGQVLVQVGQQVSHGAPLLSWAKE